MAAAAAGAPPTPTDEEALLAHPMLQGVLPLHETSDMVLVIRIRRYACVLYGCSCTLMGVGVYIPFCAP
jgi:hypothetical protein